MRYFWGVLALFVFISCDKGLEPPPIATISGKVTFVGTFPPCDSVVLLAVVLARPPEPYTDSQLIAGLNKDFYPFTLTPCSFRDTFYTFTVPAGTYNYLGVAHNYGDLFKDWQVVGFAHNPDDSPQTFTLSSGDAVTGIDIRVRFDSLPRQPFKQ